MSKIFNKQTNGMNWSY